MRFSPTKLVQRVDGDVIVILDEHDGSEIAMGIEDAERLMIGLCYLLNIPAPEGLSA